LRSRHRNTTEEWVHGAELVNGGQPVLSGSVWAAALHLSAAGRANSDTALGPIQNLLYGEPGAGGLTPMSKAISSHFQ
jgi:hypothetical protein